MHDLMKAVENGLNEHQELAARNAERIAARESGLESASPTTEPFGQQAYDLLLQSIDQVSHNWIEELAHVRKNSEAVEALVLQRAAKVKGDITALYLLGNAAMLEARRGDEVNAKLAIELEKLAEEPT
jgi:hypothetical protein